MWGKYSTWSDIYREVFYGFTIIYGKIIIWDTSWDFDHLMIAWFCSAICQFYFQEYTLQAAIICNMTFNSIAITLSTLWRLWHTNLSTSRHNYIYHDLTHFRTVIHNSHYMLQRKFYHDWVPSLIAIRRDIHILAMQTCPR